MRRRALRFQNYRLQTTRQPQSLAWKSAPLLPNPSLRDYLSNYSIWPTRIFLLPVHLQLDWMVVHDQFPHSRQLLLSKRGGEAPQTTTSLLAENDTGQKGVSAC